MYILFSIPFLIASEYPIGAHKIKHLELQNGLDLLWIDDAKPKIDTYLIYATGSAMENKDQQAHMTEHAMFCTPKGPFDKLLEPFAKHSGWPDSDRSGVAPQWAGRQGYGDAPSGAS